MTIYDYGWWTIIFTTHEYIFEPRTHPSVFWIKGLLQPDQILERFPKYSRAGWSHNGQV